MCNWKWGDFRPNSWTRSNDALIKDYYFLKYAGQKPFLCSSAQKSQNQNIWNGTHLSPKGWKQFNSHLQMEIPARQQKTQKQKSITIPWIIDNSQNFSGTKDFQSCSHSGFHFIQGQTNPGLPMTRNLKSDAVHTHIDTIPGEIRTCLLKKAKKGTTSVQQTTCKQPCNSSSLPQSRGTTLSSML